MEKKQISWSLPRVTLLAMTRRLGASILLASVVIAGCVTSVLLDRLIQRQEESLQRMIETTRINCIVTDAQGMHSDDLNMLAGFVDMLMGYRHDRGCYLDEYVMDVNAKSTVPLKTPVKRTCAGYYRLLLIPVFQRLQATILPLMKDGQKIRFLEAKRSVSSQKMFRHLLICPVHSGFKSLKTTVLLPICR